MSKLKFIMKKINNILGFNEFESNNGSVHIVGFFRECGYYES